MKRLVAAAGLALLLAGCLPFDLRDIINGEDDSALAISPQTIVLPAGDELVFSATGGVSPYVFTVASGGGEIDSETGEFTAPYEAGTTVVRVTDRTGAESEAQITIELATGTSALTIAPQAITLAVNSSVTFAAIGGTPPYTFTKQTGVGTVNTSTGLYTAPLFAGSATIRVTDTDGNTADAEVTVESAGVSLGISPSAVTLSVASGTTFTAIGGTPPYTFSITTTGSGAPDINSTTGVYVAGASAGTDIVQVEDSDSNTATATVTVVSLASSVDYTVPATSFLGTGTAGNAMTPGSLTIENSGTGDGSLTVFWKVYLSANTTMDGGDMLLASGSVGALDAGSSTSPAVGATFPAVPPGGWYLLTEVTAADDITLGNNFGVASAVTLSARDIDYEVASVTSTGGTTTGAAITGSFEITNTGADPGGEPVDWVLLASTDVTPDAADWLVERGTTAALGASVSSGALAFAGTGTWPTTPDDYYLIVVIAAPDDINPANDSGTSGVETVTGLPPADVDYVVSLVNTPGVLVAGDTFTSDFEYDNQGSEDGAADVYWTVYRSADATLTVGVDTVIDSGSVSALTSLAAPVSVPFGGVWPQTAATWHLFVTVSAGDDVTPGNNSIDSGAIVTDDADIDYQVVTVTAPGATTAGDAFTSTFTYRNNGTHAASQVVHWTAYLSANTTLEVGTDQVIDTGAEPALAAGTTSPIPVDYGGIWPPATGNWYVIVSVTASDEDPSGALPNWTRTASFITTTPPDVDYTVLVVNNTGGTIAGGTLAGNFDARNVGTHDGTEAVPWRVYVSANATLEIGTDYLVQAGSLASPGLAAATTQSAVAFTGTWPMSTTLQNWRLIVTVGAGDDVSAANDTTATAASVAVNPPDVDVRVTPASLANIGATDAAGPLSGSFTVQNNGTGNGAYAITWIAYRSVNVTLELGTDPVIDSGSRAALNAGQTSGAITFSSTWPLTSGTYYYIVAVSSEDDQNTANNTTVSAGVVVTPSPPDYTVVAPVVQLNGLPGTLLSAAGAHSFQIQNIAAFAGTLDIHWEVYASLDATLGPGDTLVASGTRAFLAAGATSPSIPFDGTWPAFASFYYLFVTADGGDDTTLLNNTWISSAILVPLVYGEDPADNNDDVTHPFNVNQVDDFNSITVDPNELIRIDGVTTTAVDPDDNFLWMTGAGVTAIDIFVTWGGGLSDVDLSFWSSTGTQFDSQDVSTSREPDTGYFTITGLTPATWYTAARLYSGASASYQLYLYGRP